MWNFLCICVWCVFGGDVCCSGTMPELLFVAKPAPSRTRVHDVLGVVCLQVVDALDSIPGLPKVTPVFVSLDPHRDSLTQMKHYKQGRP